MESSASASRSRSSLFAWTMTLLSLAVAGFAAWRPEVVASFVGRVAGSKGEAEHDDHADHADEHGRGHGDAHDHAGHDEAASLDLSPQARATIGLREGKVELSTFRKTIGVPGIVVERRGRDRIEIIAPMTGFVTKIYALEGETVAADRPLFEIRLTHEELVQAQADLLRTTEELDVVRREIARLEGIGLEGAVATKTILERRYEQQKLEAVERAQKQALLLHGFVESQVAEITTRRMLLNSQIVHVPGKSSPVSPGNPDAMLQVQELLVERGQNVEAGRTLAVLTDHATLFIEGEAFEQDLPRISAAVAHGFQVTAIAEGAASSQAVDGLAIAYMANKVDPETRTLHFYVTLPNQVVRDTQDAEGRRYVERRFRPGQRMQLRVPVEEWPQRIVLPAEAVAQDGVENFVFRSNGDHFDRQAVRVEHRDPQWVVVANDGALFPGERIALSSAQQLQLALKNKSGGAVDPHAGHNH